MAKILFLDDEERILNTYRRMVHSIGVEGVYARTSADALRLLEAEKVDLIISDYRLEQETGLDFLKEAREQGIKVPMIIISGYAEENLIKNAIALNIVQSYLIKPISLENFKKIIAQYLPGDLYECDR